MLVSEKREITVSKLFKFLTKNEKLSLNIDMIKSNFNADYHPSLKTLNRSGFEITGEFSDSLTMYNEVLGEPKYLNKEQFRLFWLMYGSNQRDDNLFELTIEKV